MGWKVFRVWKTEEVGGAESCDQGETDALTRGVEPSQFLGPKGNAEALQKKEERRARAKDGTETGNEEQELRSHRKSGWKLW